ncbi:MAG TPA: VWA domain-containing protein [Chiayiivirga sp.]|nr:VWA domain-containing protein [Chiayiivirga sp.]
MIDFLNTLHWLRPMWLWALLAVPLMAWVWRRRARQIDPWRQVCDPALLAHLSQDGGSALRTRLAPGLSLLTLGLMILALAGPAFRQIPEAVVRLQSPLIVAVDLSNAVRATDVKPDRMARVRFKLADLLQGRHEGQTALIAYAGDAFTVAPLTDDASALKDLAASLSPDVMPVPGQRPERAIALAEQLLRDGGHNEGDLLLITSDAGQAAIAAAQKARAAGLRISVLGVGTEQGAPIPRPGGGFVTDAAGNMVLPRLDTAGLRALATTGGGRYAGLSLGDSDLKSLDVLQARPNVGERESSADSTRAWQDEGPWLLLILLPLAALAFRKGWLACLALLLVLPPPSAQAFEWQDLWQRPDQRAYEALQHGQIEAARSLARDPAIAGTAAYRASDFNAAIERFKAGSGANARYNLGNALAKAGRYQDAIAAYDQALAEQPDMADATANRKAVEDWLRQQEREQQGQDGQQKQQGQNGQQNQQDQDGQDQQGQDGQQKQQGQDGQQDQQGQDGQEKQQGEDGQQKQQGQDGQQKQQGQDSQQKQQGQDSQEKQQGEDGQQKQQGQDGQQSQDSKQNPAQDAHKQGGRDGAPDEDQVPESEAEPDPEAREQAAERYAQQVQDAIEHGDGTEPKPVAGQTLSTEEAEQQQAMQHLLQRVPDDPGGLLRRKFQLEFQRRQQQGEQR